jgi:hypothetical protein
MKYSLFKRLSNQAAGSVSNDLRGSDWQLEYDKIFAELIVRECMTICADNACRAGGANTQVGEDLYLAVDLIKEHFGVDQ